MRRLRVAITLDRDSLNRVDVLVAKRVFSNRSHAISVAVSEMLAAREHSGLACECAKLDPDFEKAFADSGFGLGLEACPEY